MFDVVLHRPEIPPNTGNLMRLCVNTGNRLHLIRPLGFDLDDARLRRAGLDYREYADVVAHDDFAGFLDVVRPARVFSDRAPGRDGPAPHPDRTRWQVAQPRERGGDRRLRSLASNRFHPPDLNPGFSALYMPSPARGSQGLSIPRARDVK